MKDIVKAAELFATNKIVHEFSDRIVYHGIEFQRRLIEAIEEIGQAEELSDEELNLTKIAGWFINIGLANFEDFKEFKDPYELSDQCNFHSIDILKDFLEDKDISESHKQTLFDILESEKTNPNNKHKLGKILADATTSDFAKPKAIKRLKMMYEQFLLLGAMVKRKEEWYDTVIAYLRSHRYQTPFGKEAYEPKKDNLILKLVKEQKDLKKSKDNIISKELQVTDDELKKLKKKLAGVQGRDDRGIQTMFRTTSKNHYTLNVMVDRKANIMISINAIILSVILGRLIGQTEIICIHNSPVLIMMFFALASIMFAVLAIRPATTHGQFTREDILENKGNLLFFGNYHNMSFREYEWGMLELINDGEHLYTTMIRDIYYLGQTLNRKYKFIRKSLTLFMIGFALSVVVFLIVAPFYGTHL